MTRFLLAWLLSFILAWWFTALVRRWALRHVVVDIPDESRKFHQFATPLMGGLAIFLSFSLLALIYAVFTPYLLSKAVGGGEIVALIVGGGLLMIGGYLDDKYHQPPGRQLIWPILAALIVLGAGIKISVIGNPLAGGVIELGAVISLILTFLWLLGMMYTTKLLDGLDGLAAGIGAIGALIIFGLTQFTPFYEPPVGLLALLLAGACLGFLVWNWHPAKIFLGEGGSLYIGFVLGVLAIISGAKIATTLLVMGVPILDVVWVIIRRLFWEKKSLTSADRKHLHYRLLDAGLTYRQTVTVLYLLTGGFGITSLFLGTRGKLTAFLILLIVMAVLGVWVVWRYKRRQLIKHSKISEVDQKGG